MAVEVGRTYQGVILKNTIRSIGDKEAVAIRIEIAEEDEHGEALIFLSEKSMGMARAALRVCGFDPDKQDLQALFDDSGLLAGKPVPVEIEEYKGRAQWRIPTSTAPSKKRMGELSKLFKSAGSKASAGAAHDDSDLPF